MHDRKPLEWGALVSIRLHREEAITHVYRVNCYDAVFLRAEQIGWVSLPLTPESAPHFVAVAPTKDVILRLVDIYEIMLYTLEIESDPPGLVQALPLEDVTLFDPNAEIGTPTPGPNRYRKRLKK